MPIRATMYPGRLTQTTSMTASKTSRVRLAKSGCELCGGGLLRKASMKPLLPA